MRFTSTTTSRISILFLSLVTVCLFNVTKGDILSAILKTKDLCPSVKAELPEYHLDSTCDRNSQQRTNAQLNRELQYKELLQSGSVKSIPSTKTVYCPRTDHEDNLYFEDDHGWPLAIGLPTIWIVKNDSKYPVIILFVLRDIDGNIEAETSSENNGVFPPNLDKDAILQPGEWKAVDTFEGHSFHLRRVLPDGSLGPIVLQHRVGLVPINNAYGHKIDEYCHFDDPDPEPFRVIEDRKSRQDVMTTPSALRKGGDTPSIRAGRFCNTLDIGFRNEVGCPLNAYYTGAFEMNGNPIAKNETCSFTPKSCHEKFTFHLGTNDNPSDFMWDWDSSTKFEGTFAGHSFVFRLASNENIVVDSVVIKPTIVKDCFVDNISANTTQETSPLSLIEEDDGRQLRRIRELDTASIYI